LKKRTSRGQQLQVGDEGAGLGRRAAEGDLAGAAGVGHLAVEIQPVGRQPVRRGGGIDLLAAPEELGAGAAGGRVDFNHRRVGRDGGELQRGAHRRAGAGDHQCGQATGPRGVCDAGQDGEQRVDAGDLGQVDGGAGGWGGGGRGFARRGLQRRLLRRRHRQRRCWPAWRVGGVGVAVLRASQVGVGAHGKAQRLRGGVTAGGDRPGRCAARAVFGLGRFGAGGVPRLAGEGVGQGVGEGCDVRWPGGKRFGRQQRVWRAIPQRLAIAAPQQAQVPAGLRLAGIPPPGAAQQQRAGQQPAQGGGQGAGAGLFVVAQRGVQPGRRLGQPVGEGGLGPHPQRQAQRRHLRVVALYGLFERGVGLHSWVTPEMPRLASLDISLVSAAAVGANLKQVARQRADELPALRGLTKSCETIDAPPKMGDTRVNEGHRQKQLEEVLGPPRLL
jgi:hypothetical protein